MERGERPAVINVDERAECLCAPGVAAAVRHIRANWPASPHLPQHDPLNKPRSHTFGLAVRVAVAQELWGWGAAAARAADASVFPLADYKALKAYREAKSGRDWGPGNQIEIANAELNRRKATGENETEALTAMAPELGVSSRQALKKALTRKRRKSVQPTALGTTVVRDGRKTA